MSLANYIETYNTSRIFLIETSDENEIKKVFDDIDFSDCESVEQMNEILLDNGTTDEEIIETILIMRKGNFIVNFIDDRNDGYFQVIEIQDNIIVPIRYYEDEKTKTKTYDFEEMANDFENKLSELDKNCVVMCSVETKDIKGH